MATIVIVKGTREEAEQAAAKRGIQAEFNAEFKHGVTQLRVPADRLSAVQAWFLEPVEAEKGKGFPVGSVLFYHAEGKPPFA